VEAALEIEGKRRICDLLGFSCTLVLPGQGRASELRWSHNHLQTGTPVMTDNTRVGMLRSHTRSATETHSPSRALQCVLWMTHTIELVVESFCLAA
jgi:hypothetical protein